MANTIDLNKVGVGRAYSSPEEAEEAAQGTYNDVVNPLPDDRKFPLKQVPQVNPPTPFKLGKF